MKLTRTTLVVPLAGVMLLGAAGIVAATSTGSGTDGGAVVPAAESPSPSASAGTTFGPLHDRDSVLTDVLDELVADGTITEAQKTAITDALTAERTARREEAQARMEQLRTFLEDGVITQEEFDQLPEDSRLRAAADLMADGQITSDELRGVFGGRGGHGFRGGHGPFGGGTDDDATPAPSASPTTSG